MLNIHWRCDASAMYVNYNLPNLDTCSDLFNDYLQVRIQLYVL